jgi:hypothetical protein
LKNPGKFFILTYKEKEKPQEKTNSGKDNPGKETQETKT